MHRPAAAPESASASPGLNLQTCGWTKSGGISAKGKYQTAEPKLDKTGGRGKKKNTKWSDWKELSQKQQATFMNRETATHFLLGLVCPQLLSNCSFSETNAVPRSSFLFRRASVTLVIASIPLEVCIISSYGTTTLFQVSGAACFLYFPSF